MKSLTSLPKSPDLRKFYFVQRGRTFKTPYIGYIKALAQPLIQSDFPQQLFNTHYTNK